MYIRYAFFDGHVKPGKEAEFAAFVRDRLLPLWTTFPGASEVRVLRQADSDTAAPHYALVLAMRYPDLAAIDLALQSDARRQSRAESQELVKLFDGRVFHTVFSLAHEAALQP